MLYGPRSSKPNPGVGIDWSNGLSRGLAFLYALNENAGLPRDVVTGTRASSSIATWSNSPYGGALAFNGTSQNVNCGSSPQWSIAGPLTLAFVSNPSALSVQKNIIEFRSPTNAGGYSFIITSGNLLELLTASGSSTFAGTSSSGLLDGKWHLFAVTMNSTASNGVTFYRDGIPAGTATVSTFPSTYGSGIIGSNPGQTSGWASSPIAMAAVWNRAYSAQEHVQLAANPWSLFTPPSYRIFRTSGARPVSAADSATFTPAASSHAKRVVSTSDAATFTPTASSHVKRVASASDSATFTLGVVSHAKRVVSTSDAAIISGRPIAFQNDPVSAISLASFSSTIASTVVRHPSSLSSADFSGLASSAVARSRPAGDSAAFTDHADVITATIIRASASDLATFSDSSSLVDYLGRYRRGDKVSLTLSTPSTPDAPPIAVILDSSNNQIAALMMPASNQPRTFFSLRLPIGLTYSIGSFTVFFHYAIQDASTLQQAAFDVIPGGDSGGSVIALYSLDRVEARCIVAQLDSGVLVLGKTPTVRA